MVDEKFIKIKEPTHRKLKVLSAQEGLTLSQMLDKLLAREKEKKVTP